MNALRARTDGRHRDYRVLVNGFFEDLGLHGPLAVSDEPFSFEGLRADGAEPRHGGPLVSVIMTTYNSASTVEYAVRSILEQTHRNLELLIVDVGSTDQTRLMLAGLAAADERVRVMLNETNVGTYAAKNRAMELAEGEYVTFHDADDWAHAERIATHVDAMAANRTLVATRSPWIRVDPDGVIDFRRWQKRLVHPNPASVFIAATCSSGSDTSTPSGSAPTLSTATASSWSSAGALWSASRRAWASGVNTARPSPRAASVRVTGRSTRRFGRPTSTAGASGTPGTSAATSSSTRRRPSAGSGLRPACRRPVRPTRRACPRGP